MDQTVDSTVYGALFDMDGVIVDNLKYHEEAWALFCKNRNIPFDRKTFYTFLNGKNAFDSFTFLLGRIPTPDELVVLTEEKEQLYRDSYGPHLEAAEGLIGFLNMLRERGVRCAIATSAVIENVHFTLEGTGIRPLFDAVIDASMVQNGKPAPDIYLKAAEVVGVLPENCIVFEDALMGIQAGKAADMKVIGLSTSHTSEELAPVTDAVIADFREIDWKVFKNVLHPS